MSGRPSERRTSPTPTPFGRTSAPNLVVGLVLDRDVVLGLVERFLDGTFGLERRNHFRRVSGDFRDIEAREGLDPVTLVEPDQP